MTARPEISIQFQPNPQALEQALGHLKAAENSFRHCDALLREFCKQRMVVVNGNSVFLGDSMQSGQELRDEFIKLSRDRDQARTAFMNSMGEYARAQTGTNFQVGVLER